MAERMVATLVELGTEHALVFFGHDGLDELTTTTTSAVWEVVGDDVHFSNLDPTELGIPLAAPEDLVGGDPAANARLARAILDGEAGGGGGHRRPHPPPPPPAPRPPAPLPARPPRSRPRRRPLAPPGGPRGLLAGVGRGRCGGPVVERRRRHRDGPRGRRPRPGRPRRRARGPPGRTGCDVAVGAARLGGQPAA